MKFSFFKHLETSALSATVGDRARFEGGPDSPLIRTANATKCPTLTNCCARAQCTQALVYPHCTLNLDQPLKRASKPPHAAARAQPLRASGTRRRFLSCSTESAVVGRQGLSLLKQSIKGQSTCVYFTPCTMSFIRTFVDVTQRSADVVRGVQQHVYCKGWDAGPARLMPSDRRAIGYSGSGLRFVNPRWALQCVWGCVVRPLRC